MTTPANPFALPTTQPTSAPAQAAPAAQSSTPAPAADFGDDPFDAPAPQSDRPRVADLPGRLLLIRPIKLEEKVPNKQRPGEFQDRLTADIVVLDGGALAYGGAPEARPPRPHDKTAQVPMKINRLYVSQAALVAQCSKALEQKRMVLGRLGFGEAQPGKNAPYVLSIPTDEERAIARAYMQANPQDPF